MLSFYKKLCPKKSAMLNTILFGCYLFFNLFFFCACGENHVFPITFEKLVVKSASKCGVNRVFSGETFDIHFSIAPEYISAQNAFSMKKQDASGGSQMQVETDFLWSDSQTMCVCPKTSWTMGAFYTVSFAGNIRVKTGATYNCSFIYSFFYGGAHESALVLQSAEVINPIAPNGNCITETEIQFVFNKEVSLTSFAHNFSLSPYHVFVFEETTSINAESIITVCINGNLSPNTIYTWKLDKALCAKDGFAMLKTESGDFHGIIDTVQPFVKSVKIENEKKQKSKIEIMFSKPMEYFSVSNAWSIEPAIQGYIEQDANVKSRFLFVPQQNYKNGVKYAISILSSARDISGLGMREKHEAFLIPFGENLKIEKIISSNVLLQAADLLSNTIFDIPAASGEIIFQITFSKTIDEAAKVKAVESLALEPVFPLGAAYPRFEEASWTTSAVLRTRWSDFSVSGADSPKIYALRITGGETGISTGRGEYIEEDLCVYLKIL